MTLAKRNASCVFALAALSIYAVVYFSSRTPQALLHVSLLSADVTFNLTVTASAAFYFLLVRRGYASWFALSGVFVAGLRMAPLLLPKAYGPHLSYAKWMGAPLELLLLASVLRRMHRSGSGDPVDRIRAVVSSMFPYPRVAERVTAEICTVYYALFSWRTKPETSETAAVFPCREAIGYGLFGALLILLVLFEGLPVHFILLHYSAMAAWCLTGLSLYSLLWACAVIRSVRLRPVLLDERCLKLRVGIVWEVEIRTDIILSCRRWTSSSLPASRKGHLKAVVLNEPQFLIELARPVTAVGPYGVRRAVTSIGVAVDQPEAFASAIRRRMMIR